MSYAAETKSEFPFATREPDVFQTQILIKSGGVERRVSLARDQDKRRIDYDVGTDDHRAVIVSDTRYLLFFKRKAYSEQLLSALNAPAEYETLTSGMLTRRDYSQFEEVSRDGSVIQYRGNERQRGIGRL